MYNYHCFVPDIPSVLFIHENSLTEIDFSSLEEIVGGGVWYVGNSALCLVGDLLRFSNKPNCESTPRRSVEDCSK